MRLIDADSIQIPHFTLATDRIKMIDAIDEAPTIEPKAKVIAQVTFDEEKMREIVKEAVERFKEEYEIEPKRGEWIDKGWKGDWQFETDGRGNCWYEYECSECGFRNKGGKSNFCPNCGARMKGADDEASD